MKKEGIVYILSNPYFVEGVIKIGMTTRSVEERAWEIYVQATGVPGEFKIEYQEFAFDCAVAEKRIHEKLRNSRISKNREFFKLDIDEAIEAIRDEVKIVNSQTPKRRQEPSIKEVIIRVVDGAEIEEPESLNHKLQKEKNLEKHEKPNKPREKKVLSHEQMINKFDELINSEQLSSEEHDALVKSHELYMQGFIKKKNTQNIGQNINPKKFRFDFSLVGILLLGLFLLFGSIMSFRVGGSGGIGGGIALLLFAVMFIAMGQPFKHS